MFSIKSTVLCIAVACLAYYFYKSSDVRKPDSPVIKTLSGSLRGIISKSREGREFYEYLGIPYANPPIGSFRFESPQPVKKWKGIRDASKYGSVCLQANAPDKLVEGSEDCLFLNIFVPKLNNENKLIPIMVWIHGGFFMYGDSNMYRPEYFMDHDVILVTLNFRLGALGFLSTGDEVVRGNMGLKDQTMALRWIQANIKYFGGDAGQVTLFGESSGGALVHHHVISPLSRGLFQKAIAQSGSALAAWASRRDHAEQSQIFGKLLGCPTENTKSMIECLKATEGRTLIEASFPDLRNDIRDPISIFNPSIEYINDGDAFLPERPLEFLQKGNFSKVPIMFGTNSHEGLVISARLVRESKFSEIGENFFLHLANILWLRNHTTVNALQQLKDFYFGEGLIDSVEEFNNWTDCLTDGGFLMPVKVALEFHLKHSPSYAYYFTYKGEFSYADFLFALPGKYRVELEYMLYFIPRWFKKTFLGIEPVHYGAAHFDECALLFPLAGIYNIKAGDTDYDISRALVKAWVQYASEFESGSLQFNGVDWPSVEEGGRPLKYLNIDVNPDLVDEPHSARVNVWLDANIVELFNYS